ncbi:MAG: sugar transferase, partial [Chloroflexota bacterium]|nr:sugar transferase [Chloroflexota bacterium]
MEIHTDDHGIIESAAWHMSVVRPNILHVGDGQVARATSSETDDGWTRLLELSRHHRAGRLVYTCVLKRWIDAIISLLALVVLSPLLVVIALVILHTMGAPVIFRQTRIGRDGQPFVVYKFRTMIPDRRRGPQQCGDVDRRKTHKSSWDPRVTLVGRILRRTSLDELPQLLNVVRGEMSLVGPRPELPEIVARYQPWQHRRHVVRPGLTGWWQVQGRSDRPMHENTELDLLYIQRLSPAFDLLI